MVIIIFLPLQINTLGKKKKEGRKEMQMRRERKREVRGGKKVGEGQDSPGNRHLRPYALFSLQVDAVTMTGVLNGSSAPVCHSWEIKIRSLNNGPHNLLA